MKLYWWLVGHKFRFTYWSCTPVADWLRKKFSCSSKPHLATFEGWDNWKNENKHTLGYWLAEEGLDYLQDIWFFIPDVYNNIKHIFRNRFVDQYYLIPTGLDKFKYHEIDNRLLHGMFTLLQQFVEIEKAHMYIISEKQDKQKIPNRDLGIKYLDWECSLSETSPNQAQHADQIKSLYLWWVDERPNRPDPHEASGWDNWHSKMSEKYGDQLFNIRSKMTVDEKAINDQCMVRLIEIEQQYDIEDTEKMIELIKLRKALWT